MAIKRKRGDDTAFESLKRNSLEARQFFQNSFGVAMKPLEEPKAAGKLLKTKRNYASTEVRTAPREDAAAKPKTQTSSALTTVSAQKKEKTPTASSALQLIPAPTTKEGKQDKTSRSLFVQPKKTAPPPKPQWHAPWKLHRVCVLVFCYNGLNILHSFSGFFCYSTLMPFVHLTTPYHHTGHLWAQWVGPLHGCRPLERVVRHLR